MLVSKPWAHIGTQPAQLSLPSLEAELFQWNTSLWRKWWNLIKTWLIRVFLNQIYSLPSSLKNHKLITSTLLTGLPSQIWRQTEKLLVIVPILPKTSWEPATEMSVFKHWQMEMVSDALAFFNWALKGMTRSNGWKPKPEQFKLEIRYKFLTARVINLWNSLLRCVMDSPWSDLFKSRMHVFLRNTLYFSNRS